jgi:hypothetical protein
MRSMTQEQELSKGEIVEKLSLGFGIIRLFHRLHSVRPPPARHHTNMRNIITHFTYFFWFLDVFSFVQIFYVFGGPREPKAGGDFVICLKLYSTISHVWSLFTKTVISFAGDAVSLSLDATSSLDTLRQEYVYHLSTHVGNNLLFFRLTSTPYLPE